MKQNEACDAFSTEQRLTTLSKLRAALSALLILDPRTDPSTGPMTDAPQIQGKWIN